LAALASAAPAAAQYYPGYRYGPNSQVLVNQCATAAQARLNAGYGYNSYGYGGGRVLGISRVNPHPDGGITVEGVASSGRYAANGYGGYAPQSPVDLTWRCRTDVRGVIRELSVNGAEYNGYSGGYGSSYTPWDYSQYGYRRY
jgi:hypothetical protein